MEIDLTVKSNELKTFVSQFETTMFLGDISAMMTHIEPKGQANDENRLSSPQRQLMYLAALNVTSSIPNDVPLKPQYSDEDLEHMKKLLNEIEDGYDQYFYPKPDDIVDEEWHLRRMIAMPTFLSYFNQGILNYEEQTIERIIEYFTPFNPEIINHFGLNVSDFIEIYNFIDSKPNEFLDNNVNRKEGQQTWKEFCIEMNEREILPWQWNEHLPKHFQNFNEFIYDKGKMFRFSKQTLLDNFGVDKTNSFLEAFTCTREATSFLYYTERNILNSKPIYKITDDEYQAIDMHHIIRAIYNRLFEFCTTEREIVEKFYYNRGNKLEEKISKVFQRFFKNKCYLHHSYYTQEAHEQDLLFLSEGGLALIVEAKASKRDEPRRDPEMAYPLIVTNFEETIQKGYDQTYRVKSKFISNETLNIFRDQKLKQKVIDIRTKNYPNAFSIVVTLDRFGSIQTDLSGMLEIYEDDNYPWSICIDDLEVFLLMMEKLGKNKSDLVHFLKIREQLHGKLIANDELEICGGFLKKRITKENINRTNLFVMNMDYTDIFDHMYQKRGLGFDNEKNLEMKQSGKYFPIGGY